MELNQFSTTNLIIIPTTYRSIIQRREKTRRMGFSLIPRLNSAKRYSSVRWKSLADELCAAYGGWTLDDSLDKKRLASRQVGGGGRRIEAHKACFSRTRKLVYIVPSLNLSRRLVLLAVYLRLYHVATGWSARETGPKEPSPRACPGWCRASYVATNQLHLAENHLSGVERWTVLDVIARGVLCARREESDIVCEKKRKKVSEKLVVEKK